MDTEIVVRPFGPHDSIPELTELVHRAYAPLAAMGLKFLATHQSDEVTAKRVGNGECFIALKDGVLCGTILFTPQATEGGGPPWYTQPGIAGISQFCVDPALQAKGLGLRLITMVTDRARELGAREIALDTADPATHLVSWYTRLGFRFVEHWQWSYTNYRSVVLSRAL